MPEYRVTFGSQYGSEEYGAEPHPRLGFLAHRDGWLTIVADTEERARDLAIRVLGTAWSNIYGPDDLRTLNDWNDTFPLGELLRVIDPKAEQPLALYRFEGNGWGKLLATVWPSGQAQIAGRIADADTWSAPWDAESWPTS